jgi:hypothetical protein
MDTEGAVFVKAKQHHEVDAPRSRDELVGREVVVSLTHL